MRVRDSLWIFFLSRHHGRVTAVWMEPEVDTCRFTVIVVY